jgi:hypothetical protein
LTTPTEKEMGSDALLKEHQKWDEVLKLQANLEADLAEEEAAVAAMVPDDDGQTTEV